MFQYKIFQYKILKSTSIQKFKHINFIFKIFKLKPYKYFYLARKDSIEL